MNNSKLRKRIWDGMLLLVNILNKPPNRFSTSVIRGSHLENTFAYPLKHMVLVYFVQGFLHLQVLDVPYVWLVVIIAVCNALYQVNFMFLKLLSRLKRMRLKRAEVFDSLRGWRSFSLGFEWNEDQGFLRVATVLTGFILEFWLVRAFYSKT